MQPYCASATPTIPSVPATLEGDSHSYEPPDSILGCSGDLASSFRQLKHIGYERQICAGFGCGIDAGGNNGRSMVEV